MSRRNGDRARFQKERVRKMHRRQRIQALSAAVQQRKDAAGLAAGTPADSGPPQASVAVHNADGPIRTGD
jgi:hypothetical protein